MNEEKPPRSLKEKQRREREDLILQATEEVLLEKGFHETTMDEIAARVGIAKGTLYLHFAHKNDLVLALLERSLCEVHETVTRIAAQPGSARERLSQILRVIFPGLLIKRKRLFYALVHTVDLVQMVKEKHKLLLMQIEQQIAMLHEEGKAQGEFDKDLPTDVMTYTFFSVLFSPRLHRILTVNTQMEPKDFIDYVERIYFNGIDATENKMK
ncbi:MAG TPA: TetR/AcrR family transcriptional regulator [Ktedonobacteraceae bacterium]|nr:TetR/AcrR family transcriptional regulator [Ktedonobacteraceae bacterium]